ncbi:MAG: tRNA (guanosine(46)-N7)-methyltransferase TrmB [Sedimentisphaerales bacterium]|jgi:tRNA (guanine-N7-)-methyltransferase|nr:tRNA (guanosine(46)-N7)-methyltransferase TrmB [Sedimentisphaerales bacterium]
MGKRTLKDYPHVRLELEPGLGILDLAEVFGRDAPTHLEIGSGKGTFILNQASAQPEVNFLGIEWANRYFRYAVDRVGRWGLSNIRLIRTDAAAFVRDHLEDHTIDWIHIYFPDPWPKRRHQKRRFINDQNIEQLLRVLKKGGRMQIITDHPDYWRQIQEVLERHASCFDFVRFQPTASATAGEWVGTNFERKYLKEERAFYAVAIEKKA